jgi:hypothetical protein
VIGPREHHTKHEPGWPLCRQVFQAMHGDINLVENQRGSELFHEYALSEIWYWHSRASATERCDANDFDLNTG